MPLKAVLERLDELPEQQHGLYLHNEKDGKFYLDIEGIEEHPSTANLRNAHEQQKAMRKKAAEEIQRLKDRLAKVPDDYDPEVVEKMKADMARMEAEIESYKADPKMREVGDKVREEAVAARRMLEERMKNMEKANAGEIEKLNRRIKAKEDYIAKLLVDDGLTKALVDVGVSREYLRASKALLTPNVKVIEDEDGQYSAIVESDTGTLDIPRFVQDWVASDEGKPFIPPAKGADAGGPGKPAKSLGGDIKNPWSKEHWNLTEQGKVLKADRVRAQKLAKAAGHNIQPAA